MDSTYPITPLLDRVHTPADLKAMADHDLPRLADELRAETIAAVSVTGGHLGAGLGVVELTVALHAVFDTPRDRLIWDVGHQSYPHKILTGRRAQIRSLRQGQGLSGFTSRRESPYDPFGAAHSSTSLSAGLGMAVARDLAGDDYHVICVIGDGAMSAGMAFEAINNAGMRDHRLLIILNDNHMSIDEPVGRVSACLAARDQDPPAAETLFSSLGLDYRGPFDGHDLTTLLPILREWRDQPADGPVLLHLRTQKGKGYAPAERAADKMHGVATFDVRTGAGTPAATTAPPTYTKVFADSLTDIAAKDERLVAITAAMPTGTGLAGFARTYPDRFFDVGIAEQHAVTFAAGMAAEGYRPFAAIYSTFLQRGYDQVVHDVAVQGLPVRFAIDRAGLVGADGATHAGAFDIAYLGCLPGFVLMAAADEASLQDMVVTAAAIDDRPCAFRYPRGPATGMALPAAGQELAIGKGRIMVEGERVAILSYGARLAECLKAARMLQTHGIGATVVDARFAKPLDQALIRQCARHHAAVITVEEGSVGGFGAFVLHFMAGDGLLDRGLVVRSLTLPDRFQDHDTPERQYADAGLDAVQIARQILEALGIPVRPEALHG